MKIEQKHFDAMMKGQRCQFWDNSKDVGMVKVLYAIRADKHYPFEDADFADWQNCEPIKTVRYLKEPVEMMKTLIEGGWKPDEYGNFIREGYPIFASRMWYDCGKPEQSHWIVDPSWIEEKEE